MLTKTVVQRIVKKALAAQLKNLLPVLQKRKNKYDRARDFDENAVRNDKAMWKKKCLDLEKTAKASKADMDGLMYYRKMEMWIKAHAVPPTLRRLCRLKKKAL